MFANNATAVPVSGFRTLSRTDQPAPLQRFEFASGRVTVPAGARSLNSFIPALGIAVAPDESAVLFTRVVASDSDVLCVDGFR